MTTRLYIRRPVLYGGDHIELTADYGPRRGAPFMDGDHSLVELGMRCADGAASQGTFLFTDPYADPDADPFATSFPLAHNLVTWTEDAPGSEIWLFRGRVANDEGGRGEAVVDHETEWEITVDDGNVDLRGQAFTEHWVRPEETDVARLIALQAYILNGASSTAPKHRDSCVVTVSTSHLTPNTNTVTMPAKKYVAGSQPQDVVKDCAEMAGKNYAIVIHHTGGSHLCLFYTVPGDHTTYVSPITISDHVADWDPVHPTNPVLEPHWERGNATIFGMQQMLSGMVGVWGSSEEAVFVEDTAVRDNYEYWVESTHTSATTAAESEDKTAGIFFQRKQLNVTHRVSVILEANQVHMVGAGMSLLMRTAATHDPDVESYITRRIVECRFEPRNDGRYWCHMDIERPLLLNRYGPGHVGAIPPVQSEPPVGETIDWEWNFDTNLGDTTQTSFSAGKYDTWGNPGGSTYIASLTSSGWPGNGDVTPAAITPGTYHFRGDFWNNSPSSNPSGIKVTVTAHDVSHNVIFTHTSPFIGAADHTWDTYTTDLTFPAGTTHWIWTTNPYKGNAADNVILSHGGSGSGFVGTSPPPASSGGSGSVGTSPIAAPIDHEHPAQTAEVTSLADVGGYFESFFVEGALQELAARAWKQPVRAATTAAGTLATSFENGDTVDGVVLATGDRILIKDQAAGAENGIYTVNATGAPTRATDFDAASEVLGAMVMVTNGTANADKAFQMTTNAPITLGTTALTFAEFGTGVTDHGALSGLADDDHPQYVLDSEMETAGHFEVVVSGTAPPVAVTNEAEDDWVYGFVSG